MSDFPEPKIADIEVIPTGSTWRDSPEEDILLIVDGLLPQGPTN